jgi:3-hydroxyisobutyrate dehydrogenase-like beta-hydroxyacid dehydrogenase
LATLQVGFIGIGNMGMPMAKSLVKNGLPVTVFDLNQNAVAEIKLLGASAAGSPRELSTFCDSIICMVRDESQIDQIIFGQNGIWEGITAGKSIIISSTASPGYCRQLYVQAAIRKVRVLDAPVTDPSGQKHVLGGLTIMLGGDKDAVDRNWPIFQAMGKNIFYMGQIGNGQVCKLVHQINAFNIGMVTRESLNMGVKAGLDLKTMVEALSHGLGSTRGLQTMAENLKKSKPSSSPRTSAARPTAGGMGVRDRKLALELAREAGAEMPVADCIQELDASLMYQAYSSSMDKYQS